MAFRPERAGRPRSALRNIILSFCVGLALGVVHIASALGLEGSFVAAVRLAISIGLLAMLYAIWRQTHGVAASTIAGLLAGLGYFGAALYWLGSSANPDPNGFIFREVILTAGALCLFFPWWGLWFGGAKALARWAHSDLVAFILFFSVANLLLGDLVYGMPMAPISLAALDTPMAGLLTLIGQFGLDTLLVSAGALIAISVGTTLPRALLASAVLSAALVAVPIPDPRSTLPDGAGPRVYLAQPALPHVSMIDPNRVLEIVHGEMYRQVQAGVAAGASLIVLPENAMLDDLTSNAEIVSEIAALLPPSTVVLTGFGRVEVIGEGADFTVLPYNSSMLIGRDGTLGIFDKAHLVPFGETMPQLFFDLGFDVVAGPAGGYGSADRISVIGGTEGVATPPFALLICYEAMLSGAVARETDGANWLLNISAETLFRGTIGPRILLDQVRMRAIETGLPVLRATAHAYSGVIAPSGTLISVLDAEDRSGIIADIPQPVPTMFRSAGYLPLYVVLGIFAMALSIGRFLRRNDTSLATRTSNP